MPEDAKHLDRWIALTRELALASGELILKHYGTALDVQAKADRTPVTIADRQAEALLRRMIRERCPEHAVLGEEEGLSGPPDAEYRWVLDPIDGTKAFIHRVPLFGTLIALLHRGRPVIGAIHLCALGELMIGAAGRPTEVNGKPVRVSRTDRLDQATVLYTDSRNWAGNGVDFQRMQERAFLVRGWGDCFGHFQVAAGRADAMIDPILAIWDVAALKPCVEGAGGTLTSTRGQSGSEVGDSAVSSNGLLHAQVLGAIHA
jgi:histidinol phosphatase-like enzyme (inositol monophosphatase family)